MARFVNINGVRVNVDTISSYRDHMGGVSLSNIYGDVVGIPNISAAEMDKMLAGTENTLSDSDRDLLLRVSNRMEELRNALGWMPTSMRVHF